jgi:hypothetical protein
MQPRKTTTLLTAAVVSLFSLIGTAAQAQEAPKGPLASLAQRLATKGVSAEKTKHGATSSTRFKPSGTRLTLDETVKSLGQSAEQQDVLRQLLTQGTDALEAEIRKAGRPNDISVAFALFISTQWSIATGKEVSDAANDSLLAQTDNLLDTPEVRALSDADKQRFYEYCTFLTVFSTTVQQTANDDTSKRNARAAATQIFKTLLPVEPSKISITAKGMTLPGGSAPAAPAAGNNGSTTTPPPSSVNLSVPTLPGWEKKVEQGIVTYARSVQTSEGGLSVKALVLTEAARKGTPEALANDLFDQFLRPLVPAPGLPKELRPEVFRRYVGNNLRCSFTVVSRTVKKGSLDYLGTSQEMHLFAVESGGTVIPVVFALNGHDGTGPDGKFINSSIRHEWVEEMLNGLSGTPVNKPLFTNAELAGAYSMSSSTLGPQFYNVNTGASVGYAYVSRGGKMTLGADGTFEVMNYGASGIGGPANFQIEKGKGKYRLEKDGNGIMLIMTDSTTGRKFHEKLAGAFTLPGSAGKVIITIPMKALVTPASIAQSNDRYLTNPPKK